MIFYIKTNLTMDVLDLGVWCILIPFFTVIIFYMIVNCCSITLSSSEIKMFNTSFAQTCFIYFVYMIYFYVTQPGEYELTLAGLRNALLISYGLFTLIVSLLTIVVTCNQVSDMGRVHDE